MLISSSEIKFFLQNYLQCHDGFENFEYNFDRHDILLF